MYALLANERNCEDLGVVTWSVIPAPEAGGSLEPGGQSALHSKFKNNQAT